MGSWDSPPTAALAIAVRAAAAQPSVEEQAPAVRAVLVASEAAVAAAAEVGRLLED